MSIQLNEEDGGKILVVQVSGMLTKADYERFVPKFDRLIEQHGKLQVLFDMTDFHGWDVSALWEDLKFDLQHLTDIERMAMVGENKWQHAMATLSKPFTTAMIRYFDHADTTAAQQWLSEAPHAD
ncbi:MAG: STAS/SEC14 domain-containing protein [Elainellaceae cyanobacterium]